MMSHATIPYALLVPLPLSRPDRNAGCAGLRGAGAAFCTLHHALHDETRE